MKTETTPASLAQIESVTNTFSKAHEALAQSVKAVNDQIDAIKAMHIRRLKRQVAELAAAHTELEALIKSAPALFEKPRTYIFHGVKVGMGKKKGTIEIADPDKTVELIEKHLKDLAEALINTTKTPIKKALGTLTGDQLKKIGCQVTKDTDAVVISPTDGEIEKAIAGLLKDATEDLQEAEAA